jgi:integrase
MHLTDKILPTLTCPPGRTEVKIFDDDVRGFGVRIRAGSAARSWIFQYDIGSRTRRVTLGSPKSMTTTRARAAAAELQAKVRLGQDPAGDKAESRVRSAETFKAVLDVYMTGQRAQLRPVSYLQKERHLLKHARGLHHLLLAKIDRRLIAGKLSKIETNSGPIESNRVRASLSAFFAWAICEGYLENNPVTGTARRNEKARERVLTDAELAAIWAATADQTDYSAIVRLLLLTACRATEVGLLRWSEIVDENIVLPGSRVKNARNHVVPLSAPARAILEARPREFDRDFIFGRRAGFTGWSACKILLDERIKAAGAEVAPWVNHDLRRTVATKMAEIGVAPHIIEAILNHVSGHKAGVAGIYNRASYEREKRVALALWADALTGIVEGEARKVVSMRA